MPTEPITARRAALRERVRRHVETQFGPVGAMFREEAGVDVAHVPPAGERDFHVLVTCGLSDRAMKAPAEAAAFRLAELMLCLPGDWRLSRAGEPARTTDWPVRWLRTLARFPHEYGTWLGYGHVVPNGEPPAPLAAGTRLCAWFLLDPVLAPPDFRELRLDAQPSLHFWAAVPLHRDEAAYRAKEGADALRLRLRRRGVTELLDPRRPSVFKRRWLLF